MTASLQPDDVLEREIRLQLAEIPGKKGPRLLVRHPKGVRLIDGVARQDAEAVLAEVDGKKRAEDVVDALAQRYDTRRAVRLLRRLFGEALYRVAPAIEGRVIVWSHTPAGEGLVERLECRGLRDVELVRESGAVARRLEGAGLVVAIPEQASYRALFEVQKTCLDSGVPSLYVTSDADGVRLGPSVVPGETACFACAQLAAFAFLGPDAAGAVHELRTLGGGFGSVVLEATADEAWRILAPEGEPALSTRVRRFSPRGETDATILPSDACPLRCAGECSPEVAEAEERGPRAALLHDGEDLVRSVGILGGGTAGYLTALALRHRLPHLDVTLVESSAVPIIGVGEATTPLMPQFLHADLGLDVHELFREVEPTLKLGIRFLWGDPEGFNYPFGPLRTLDAYTHDGHVRHCSLRSMMMTAERVPVLEQPDGPRSRLDTEVAYHLDNARFVRFLKRKAQEAGIRHVDATVTDVEVASDGEEVRALSTEDGRRLSFDLYVDCSGFRSLLVGEALRSPFESFAGSLFTDRAWVATAPNAGAVAPYTQAEAYDSGWCWSTPQATEDHRGYVFCSAFASPEDALTEMRAKNPGLGESRLVKFRAGRHVHFWKGNAVALGNAYGFVEPLESTALHMLVRQIGLLLQAFPLRRGGRGPQALLNRKVGAAWDYLRWFLALHYKFNRRLTTPFWRACTSDVDVSAHGELLETFTERGPLSYDRTAKLHFDYPDPLWGPEGIDVILLGQDVASRLPRPRLDRDAWTRWTKRCRSVVSRSLTQDRALELLGSRPRLLERLASQYRSAGAAFPVF